MYVDCGGPMPTVPSNQIFVLHPYKYNGLYVFDKEEWGTVKEVFVPSATEFLRVLSGDRQEFNLLFSTSPFPASHKVDLIETDESGSLYNSKELGMTMWLCPYLFMFYSQAPEHIYLQIV